jgi:hypothetical protein
MSSLHQFGFVQAATMQEEICSSQYKLCTEVDEDIYGCPDLPLSTETQRRINWGSADAENGDSGEGGFDEEAAGCKPFKHRQYFYVMTPKQWAKFTGHAYIPGKKRWRWLRGLNVLASSGLKGMRNPSQMMDARPIRRPEEPRDYGVPPTGSSKNSFANCTLAE